MTFDFYSILILTVGTLSIVSLLGAISLITLLVINLNKLNKPIKDSTTKNTRKGVKKDKGIDLEDEFKASRAGLLTKKAGLKTHKVDSDVVQENWSERVKRGERKMPSKNVNVTDDDFDDYDFSELKN